MLCIPKHYYKKFGGRLKDGLMKSTLKFSKYRKGSHPKRIGVQASSSIQLHIFVDANEMVYDDAAYLRISFQNIWVAIYFIKRKFYTYNGTNLIINYYHNINHSTWLNEIRQKFYIPKLRVEFNEERRIC